MATKKNSNEAVNLKGILNTLEETVEETVQSTINDTNSKTNIDTNINIDTSNDTNNKFTLKKKLDDKKEKKAFNVYMNPDLIKELDKISKKSGYSRNELINLMCEYCVKNLELI
ncbi:hypothetical protein Ccar_25885 (plasmid) [Clostridium carboxidivorans P7]|uniref:Uncharacterized protein n=1 Tax=Clostridium carboxidivorans P7 TaxID=536227 RepID=C6Q307_9CLOT|nr:ribbon-helix-helix domain-containing protein [Clostridium carboxidivorans]ADO12125.1 hypothetical protein Ccar_4285 [Clostridium carboxidivorans P7]AKN34260.1 hypothetical protein Ccar_25885 [Clostridium carboxidivorans P7]EET84122.1 conserved hypothetical protein [Clostridium carboxidivorans P7]EFG87519.1 hypothetical protein CLCAR_3054 [Clostridium carboxidivorans P7]